MYADREVVKVHSVAEAYLYLMVLRCRRCGRGPMRHEKDITRTPDSPGGWSLIGRCAVCSAETTLSFAIDPAPTRGEAASGRVNATSEPSRAIDLLGWLSLFQTILTEAQKQPNKTTARELTQEAAVCLDEAFKFYSPDNELPDEAAFFREESLRRFRDHPEFFSRTKWRERRLLLPEGAASPQPLPAGRRRWWHFWRPRHPSP